MHRPESNTDNNIIEVKNNILEEGIECFTHWLSAEEGNSEKKLFQLNLKYLKKIIQYLYTIISRILISE